MQETLPLHTYIILSLSDDMGLSTVRTTKKKTNDGGTRFLITVTILGSTGPIRLVVKGDDDATAVIGATLRIYAREGRFPPLGSDASSFFLYPAHAGFQGSFSHPIKFLMF